MTTIVFNSKRIAGDSKVTVFIEDKKTAPVFYNKINQVSNQLGQMFLLAYTGGSNVGILMCAIITQLIQHTDKDCFTKANLEYLLIDYKKQFSSVDSDILILTPTGQCVTLVWKFVPNVGYYELVIYVQDTVTQPLVYGSGVHSIPAAIFKIRSRLTVEEIAWLCAKYDRDSAVPIYYCNVGSKKIIQYDGPKPARLAVIKEMLTECLN
jgi:hypothetical protein